MRAIKIEQHRSDPGGQQGLPSGSRAGCARDQEALVEAHAKAPAHVATAND
jgi:hypothetical protein